MTYTVKDISRCIEEFAPLAWQANWDNSGLLVGDANALVDKVLLTVDVNEQVVEEAVNLKAQMIICHHPVIFTGIKQLTNADYTQRTIISAIKNDIAIYAGHTNIDSAPDGISYRMAYKLGMTDLRVLSPQETGLYKLVTFVPINHLKSVQDAIFAAGAGHFYNYDCCGYTCEGSGTFRALEGASPFVGTKNSLHTEPEVRFETIFASHLKTKIITALCESHPYEEPAFDIYSLKNEDNRVGFGIIGKLPFEMSEIDFLQNLKKIFSTSFIRHTDLNNKKIQTVALCGGAGAGLIRQVAANKADAFVSSDFKYHEFIEAAERNLMLADIGHFESEQFAKEIFFDVLNKKFTNFAVCFSNVKTNPINYF